MNQHFKIIITCGNAEKWIGTCLSSLILQTYTNWQALIIDDASTDETNNIIKKLIRDSNKFVLLRQEIKKPKILNYINFIKEIRSDNDDVLVFLDGDDWLSDKNVLAYLAEEYKNDAWITWGSFTEVNGKNPILFDDYSDCKIATCTRPVDAGWNTRNVWRYSHLKTAKYFLWKNIKNSSFLSEKDNQYFPAAVDVAFMFPMVEMAGPYHAKHIDRLMYVYNNGNRDSFMHIIPVRQKECFQELKKRNSYKPKTRTVLCNAKIK